MRENDEHDRYLPEPKAEKDRLFVDVPTETKTPYQDRLPSGYDPMQSISLEGRAYRGLAGGRIPWWILISGWVLFGGFALLTVSLTIASGSFGALPLLFFNGILIAILWRGTAAKISVGRNRRPSYSNGTIWPAGRRLKP
jgi:hypothetical protein